MTAIDNPFSRTRKSEGHLREEVADLRRQVANLSRTMGEMGHGAYLDASGDVREALKMLRKRRKKVTRALRRRSDEAASIAAEYPLTTVAAFAGFGLLAIAYAAWTFERDQ